MYVFINGKKFTEEPSSCGACPFFFNGRTEMTPSASPKGLCALFDETHNSYIAIPRRCHKLFKKAFTFQEGENLVITATTKNYE